MSQTSDAVRSYAVPVRPSRLMNADVTVVVVAHDVHSVSELERTVSSIESQRPAPGAVMIVVDGAAGLHRVAERMFPDLDVQWVKDAADPSLCRARNAAVDRTLTDLVAFLDVGAIADVDWLATATQQFDDDCVGGVDTTILPEWERTRPRWLPTEMDWVVGCSHSAYPSVSCPVRTTFGTGTLFRTDLFREVGGFKPAMASASLGVHDDVDVADYCRRVRQAFPATRFVHAPSSQIMHPVSAEKATLRYLVRRCYQEGRRSAGNEAASPQDRSITTMDRRLVTRVLPAAALRGLADLGRGRPAGAARTATVVSGLGSTAVGFVHGSLRPA